METSYLISQLDIIRRIAERGRNKTLDPTPPYLTKSSYIDLFQHILDEVERTKLHVESNPTGPEGIQLRSDASLLAKLRKVAGRGEVG